MVHDPEYKRINVSYPVKSDPSTCLVNNRWSVLGFQINQERLQIKSGVSNAYNDEFEKFMDRGAIVPITGEELHSYSGPVNYVTHHSVLKDSMTTPVRLVSNSSVKNNGTSLNDCLVKGPDTLNPMLDNLIRFRGYEVGICFDITKAYNALKTSTFERNLRRVLWRKSPDDDWGEYAFDVVQFGDRPAACLMQLGVEMAANIAIEQQEVKLAHIRQVHDAIKSHVTECLCDRVVKEGVEATMAREIIADA